MSKIYKWRLKPVWHTRCYIAVCMATDGRQRVNELRSRHEEAFWTRGQTDRKTDPERDTSTDNVGRYKVCQLINTCTTKRTIRNTWFLLYVPIPVTLISKSHHHSSPPYKNMNYLRRSSSEPIKSVLFNLGRLNVTHLIITLHYIEFFLTWPK